MSTHLTRWLRILLAPTCRFCWDSSHDSVELLLIAYQSHYELVNGSETDRDKSRMRNPCLNGLDRTSLLNKEQSCRSSRLHCVVMAIDDFHHFQVMKRNKELRSKEISPSGEHMAGESDTILRPLLCRTLPGICFWFPFAGQFHPARPESKLISTNELSMP